MAQARRFALWSVALALWGCGGGGLVWDSLSTGNPPTGNGAAPITPFKFDEGVFSGSVFYRTGQTGGRAVASADNLRRVGARLFETSAKRVSRMDRFVFVPTRKPQTELIAETYTYEIIYADGTVTDTVKVTGKVSYDPDDPTAPYYQELREQGLDYDLTMLAYEAEGEYLYQEEGHVPSLERGRPDQVKTSIEETLSNDGAKDEGVYWSEFTGADGSLLAWEDTWTHTLDVPTGNPMVSDSRERTIAAEADGYWVATDSTYQDHWGAAAEGRQAAGEWVVVSSTGHETGDASDGTRWVNDLFADGHTEGAFWDERGDLAFRYLIRTDGSEVWWDAAGNVIAETAPGEEWFAGYWVFDFDTLEWDVVDEATLRELPLYQWDPSLVDPVPLTDSELPTDGVYLYDPDLGGWVYVAENDLASLLDGFAEGVDALWPNYRWDAGAGQPVLLADNEWPEGDGDWLRVAELPGWVWVERGDLGTVPDGWLAENQLPQRSRPASRRQTPRPSHRQVTQPGAHAHTPLPRSVRRKVALPPGAWRGR